MKGTAWLPRCEILREELLTSRLISSEYHDSSRERLVTSLCIMLVRLIRQLGSVQGCPRWQHYICEYETCVVMNECLCG